MNSCLGIWREMKTFHLVDKIVDFAKKKNQISENINILCQNAVFVGFEKIRTK